VDEADDFKFVEAVYSALYPYKPEFNMTDILDLLRSNPELMEINQRFDRNEGLKRSLEKDQNQD